MAGLYTPETVRRVLDAVCRRYRDDLHLCRMGRATLMTGPHAEQSVGLWVDSGSDTQTMTEQAFTLAMGDLRLDVGHGEGSSKELPDLAYERRNTSLQFITEYSYAQVRTSARSARAGERADAPGAAPSQIADVGHSSDLLTHDGGPEDTTEAMGADAGEGELWGPAGGEGEASGSKRSPLDAWDEGPTVGGAALV
eukprot:6202377-Pleurochrysis_carterae.AAC.2